MAFLGAIALCKLPATGWADTIVVDLAYTAELRANTTGGLNTGSTYLDNFDAAVTIDADRAFGWTDTEIHLSALYNNSGRLSEQFVGDIQTVSNIETEGALRLYEAWLSTKVGQVDLKVGAIDLNSEFDVTETAGLFTGSSHGIGPDFSQVGENGPSIFPTIGLGARAQVGVSDRWTAKVGIFEGTPGDPDRPGRTRFGLNQGEGALGVIEVSRRIGKNGRAAAGIWHHSARFDAIEPGVSGERRLQEGPGGYVIVDVPITASDDGRSLSAFLRMGIADAKVHRVDRYLGAGIVAKGLAIEEDLLGLAIAVASNGKPFQRTSPESDKNETAIELTYQTSLSDYLTVQPNLQYIINPGAEPNLNDALVLGLRAVVSWSSAR